MDSKQGWLSDKQELILQIWDSNMPIEYKTPIQDLIESAMQQKIAAVRPRLTTDEIDDLYTRFTL